MDDERPGGGDDPGVASRDPERALARPDDGYLVGQRSHSHQLGVVLVGRARGSRVFTAVNEVRRGGEVRGSGRPEAWTCLVVDLRRSDTNRTLVGSRKETSLDPAAGKSKFCRQGREMGMVCVCVVGEEGAEAIDRRLDVWVCGDCPRFQDHLCHYVLDQNNLYDTVCRTPDESVGGAMQQRRTLDPKQ